MTTEEQIDFWEGIKSTIPETTCGLCALLTIKYFNRYTHVKHLDADLDAYIILQYQLQRDRPRNSNTHWWPLPDRKSRIDHIDGIIRRLNYVKRSWFYKQYYYFGFHKSKNEK